MLPSVCVLICSVAFAAGLHLHEHPAITVRYLDIPTLSTTKTPLTTTAPVTTTTAPSRTTTTTSVPSTEKSNVDGSMDKSKDSVDENKKLNSQHLSDIFYQTTGNKFYVSRIWKNWDDAAKGCKDVGMELASITSQKEQLELFKFLFVNDLVPEDDFSGYWMSGHQLDNGLYKWTGVNKFVGCWGWLPHEPSHVDDLEHCLELKHEAGSVRIGWNNFKCERKLRFICQQMPSSNKDDLMDKVATNPAENNAPETDCYYFYKNPIEPVPFEFTDYVDDH